MQRSLVVVPAIIASAFMLSACGSTVTPTTTTTTTTTTKTTTPVTTSTSAVTRNLVVTPSIRQSLLDAAAKYHSLPSSDYVGLDAGRSYYAFDPSTNTYYAAAGLNPSRKSMPAQVGTQDDGAYNLFTKLAGAATWTVYNDGLGGVQGTKCPIMIPAAVLSVWNWSANSCYPPS